jgi:hypothetical protein
MKATRKHAQRLLIHSKPPQQDLLKVSKPASPAGYNKKHHSSDKGNKLPRQVSRTWETPKPKEIASKQAKGNQTDWGRPTPTSNSGGAGSTSPPFLCRCLFHPFRLCNAVNVSKPDKMIVQSA